MAKKKSRRVRKRAREQKRGQLSAQQLVGMGRQRLEAGEAREALDCFKQAQRKDGALEGLEGLFFRAYVLRIDQLKAKGMAREARAVRNLAEKYRDALDVDTLTDVDFGWYLNYLPFPEAMAVYAEVLGTRGVLPEVERGLADRVVVTQGWEAVSVLPDDHPLLQGAAWVWEAMPAMEAGQWERAEQELAPISRRSPFAPWRVFCRAMASFVAEDDAGLGRAVALLPEDFALSGAVSEFRRVLTAEGTPGPDGALLWEGGLDVEVAAQALIAAVRQGNLREVGRLVPPLSRALYPEDPDAACETLLQILGVAVRSDGLPLSQVLRLAGQVLPDGCAQRVSAKVGIIAQQPSHAVWDVDPAVAYLSMLKAEFPDARDQALAQGRVLAFLARSGHRGGVCPFCVGSQVMNAVWDLVGKRSDDPHMMFADLMLAGLKADPDDRDGYLFLLDLLKDVGSVGPQAEAALKEMMARFPEDAGPCLELATLYYGKNAYRKAEAALEEAKRRAPHDDGVLDRQAIGYVKSADQSRNRGRWRLAWKDYARAEALGRRLLEPILFVKRLGFDLVKTGEVKEVEQQLADLKPPERLRMLALLMLDLEGVGRVEAGVCDRLEAMLGEDEMAGLTSSEVVALMTPLKTDLELLFEDLQVASVFSGFWDVLLGRAEGDDLESLFDILLACDEEEEAVMKEIDRRLVGVKRADRDPVLLFYLAAIRHMEGIDFGPRRFQEVVDRADPGQQKRLRAAATRLAEFAHGPLREALQRFDFDVLDRMPTFRGLPAFDEILSGLSDGLGGFEAEEDEEEEEEDALEFLDELEAVIDAQGLRGAPLGELKEAAGQFRSDPEVRRDWDRRARALGPLEDDLSREAYFLLYPRRGRQRSRR